jgi:hypothetical protein
MPFGIIPGKKWMNSKVLGMIVWAACLEMVNYYLFGIYAQLGLTEKVYD